MIAPILILGWGNLSRGDDALGPLLLDGLHTRLTSPQRALIDFLDEFQLQIEHALDMLGRSHILLVDASLDCAAPFEVSEPRPAPGAEFSTHALSPQALLYLYQELHGEPPPRCTLLAIRGEQFGLGEAPSALALEHLEAALRWVQRDWLRKALRDVRGEAPRLRRPEPYTGD